MMEITVKISISGDPEYVNKKFLQLVRITKNNKLIKGWLLTDLETLHQKKKLKKCIWRIKQ